MSDKALKDYYAACGALSSKAMAAKARRGDFPGCAPVGYRNVHTKEESKGVVIDEKLGPLVQETFVLAAKGIYSYRQLLKIMAEKGLVSRNGKALGPTALRNLLMNPFYVGKIRYKDELLPGNHQALIADRLYDHVQQQLESRARR